MRRFITFFVQSRNAIDFDNNVPLVLEYAKTRKVLIICSDILSFENSIFNKFPILEGISNIRVIYLDDIFSFGILSFLGIKKRKLYKFLVKISLLFNITNRLKYFCFNSDLIFATNKKSLKNNYKTVEDIFYKYSKEAKAVFVGSQLIPWVSWYQSYLFDFDYFLCSSKNEFNELKAKNFDIKLVYKGCPSFDINYLNLYRDNSFITNKDTKIKTALFIMSNTTNPIYNHHHVIYKEVKNLIVFLESHSYKCIMRLHPSSQLQDEVEFNKIGISSRYLIKDSIESISSKIDIAISYMSTTSLKCIAYNIRTVTYIPDSLIESFLTIYRKSNFSKKRDSIDLMTNFYFKSKDFKNYKLEDFSHVIKTPEQILAIKKSEQKFKREKFIEEFNPKNASANIIEYFNLIRSKL